MVCMIVIVFHCTNILYKSWTKINTKFMINSIRERNKLIMGQCIENCKESI